MPFTIPNDVSGGTAEQHAQASPDAIDFAILALGSSGVGVISGCAVTSNNNMTVAVAAGNVGIPASTAVTGGNVTITNNATTFARFDLIVSSNAGVLSAVAGTAAAVPVFPAIPANSIVLAVVYVSAGAVSIVAADIIDKRVFVAQGSVLSVAGKTGAVTLVEGDVTNLVTDLAAKATDTTVVHLAGPETITGAKTFSTSIAMGANKITGLANGTVATDAATFGQITSVIENVNVVAAAGATQTVPDITIATINDYKLTVATCTFTFPTAAAGKSFLMFIRQDATGGRTAVFPGTVSWFGGTVPVLQTAANAWDLISFICTDGTNWLASPVEFFPGGDTNWTNLTLTNSWVPNAGTTDTPKFRKTSNGMVVMTGAAKTGTAGTSIGTIPVLYRPAVKRIFVSVTGAGSFGELDVMPDGTIIPGQAGNAFQSLDCTWYAEQ